MTDLTPLVTHGDDGEPTTTSLIIARETDNQHKNVLGLVRAHISDFEEFGRVAFQTQPLATAGGTQNAVTAVLNEPQSTLLMTYLRNSDVVREFKKRLVHAFVELRRENVSAPEVEPRLGDLLDELEDSNGRTAQAIQIAREERARADKAEAYLEAAQKHRAAIEGGDGIHLTDFGKKYFSETPAREFDRHLYERGWLINQRLTRERPDGSIRDGVDHRKPTAKGRPFIYDHDQGNFGGKRRFQPRVRPQKEIDLRDALAAEGLPVNTHSTGLVLITRSDLKELGA